MSETWKSKDLGLRTKLKLAKVLIWSTALYGCESLTLRKAEEKMIVVLQKLMWLWRHIWRVSGERDKQKKLMIGSGGNYV